MSYFHQRVIILNKPLKVFGFEPKQLLMLSVWVVSGLIIAGRFPGDWKFNNFPIGVWFFIAWMCLAVAVVMGTRLKPLAWWRNIVFYKLGMVPTVYVSRVESGPIYPDGNIIDEVKKNKETFLVQAENTEDFGD
ncbi:MAG TPA: hypothetical protein V6D08_02820 [Candidatus Obscuribacterales bacterium]